MQKKYMIIFTVILVIFAGVFMYLMISGKNDDIVIYTHQDSSFSFAICDVSGENELKIKITEYSGKDMLSSVEDQPEARDVSYTLVNIPKQYHISRDNIVLYNGHIHKQISPQESRQYALADKKIDYYVYGNRKCFPSIIGLSSGNKLLIYKSADKLYITEV